MQSRDAAAYAKGTEEDSVRRYAHLPEPSYTEASTAEMIAGPISDGLVRGDLAVLTIADPATDEFAGSLVIFDITSSNAEIGFWIHPDFRGHGLTCAALDLVIEFTRRGGLQQLHARTVPENQASQRVLERAGFAPGTFVGTTTPSGQVAVTVPFTRDLAPICGLPLSTSRLQLRLYEHADAEPLQRIYTQPDVAKYLLEDPWTEEDALRQISGRISKTGLDSTSHSLALVIEYQGKIVGDVMLRLTDIERDVAEIGWVLAPNAGGQGLATEAVSAVLDLGLTVYKVHRIVAQMDARNRSSARLAERVGMLREAHLRQNWWNKGEWTDTLIYAILATDIRKHRRMDSPGALG